MSSQNENKELFVFYTDHDQKIQGPFKAYQVLSWYKNKYFEDLDNLEFRFNDSEEFHGGSFSLDSSLSQLKAIFGEEVPIPLTVKFAKTGLATQDAEILSKTLESAQSPRPSPTEPGNEMEVEEQEVESRKRETNQTRFPFYGTSINAKDEKLDKNVAMELQSALRRQYEEMGKHSKKRLHRIYELGGKEIPMECVYCKIDLPYQYQFIQHILSKRHMNESIEQGVQFFSNDFLRFKQIFKRATNEGRKQKKLEYMVPKASERGETGFL